MRLFTTKKSLSSRVEKLEKALFITNRRLVQVENLILDGYMSEHNDTPKNDSSDDFKSEILKDIEEFLDAL